MEEFFRKLEKKILPLNNMDCSPYWKLYETIQEAKKIYENRSGERLTDAETIAISLKLSPVQIAIINNADYLKNFDDDGNVKT